MLLSFLFRRAADRLTRYVCICTPLPETLHHGDSGMHNPLICLFPGTHAYLTGVCYVQVRSDLRCQLVHEQAACSPCVHYHLRVLDKHQRVDHSRLSHRSPTIGSAFYVPECYPRLPQEGDNGQTANVRTFNAQRP